jgi:hypothetical protein
MRTSVGSESQNTVEALEPRFSQAQVSLGVTFESAILSSIVSTGVDDDPLPDPEPVPPPYPGENPPIEYPTLPPAGPAGPGN